MLPARCRVIVWAPACSCQFIRPSASPSTTMGSDFRDRGGSEMGMGSIVVLRRWGKIATRVEPSIDVVGSVRRHVLIPGPNCCMLFLKLVRT